MKYEFDWWFFAKNSFDMHAYHKTYAFSVSSGQINDFHTNYTLHNKLDKKFRKNVYFLRKMCFVVLSKL